MSAVLEVTAGVFAGKRLEVSGGQTVTVGRTPRANFAVPHDTFMSGLHFSVECGPNGCLLTDQKSANGTFVNKTRVTQALLKNGDEVRSGQTIFAVRVVEEPSLQRSVSPPIPESKPATSVSSLPPLPPPPPRPTERTASLDEAATKASSAYKLPMPVAPPLAAPPAQPFKTPPPAPAPPTVQRSASVSQPPTAPPKAPKKPILTIGSWTFAAIPERWAAQGDYGIQRDVPDMFPSSVVVTEESLGDGVSLQQYVEAQLSMLRQYLREPQMEAAPPPVIQGADETVAVDVRYKTKEGQGVFYRRIYSRVAKNVGIFTFTTLENDLAQLRPALDAIVAGAGFGRAPEA